jgi:hypothetical protein
MQAHHNEQRDYMENKEILQKSIYHYSMKKNNVTSEVCGSLATQILRCEPRLPGTLPRRGMSGLLKARM